MEDKCVGNMKIHMEHRSNYLAVLDKREYYNNAYNYCPYCGNKLEERRQSDWKS